jgi:hypothetical protein
MAPDGQPNGADGPPTTRSTTVQAHEPIPAPATELQHAERSTDARRSSKRRAAVVVVAAYLAVWAGLVALLLSRPERPGEFGDPRILGILFVSISLGVALLISLLWLVGWRFCALIVGSALVLIEVPHITSDAGFSLVAAGIGAALVYAALAAKRPAPTAGTAGTAGTTSASSAAATTAATAAAMIELVFLPILALLAMGFFWFGEAMRVGLP